MARSMSTGFNKYEVTNQTLRSSRAWEEGNMYKTSYYLMSEKNPLALQNSTEQLLKTKSTNLLKISPRDEYHIKPVENTDYINHDYDNLYRTSYNDMYAKLPKLVNSHYIPRYQGFIPGMKSKNPFAATFTKLAKEQITNFDNKRFEKEDQNSDKDWQYNPLSKTHGNFWKKKKMVQTMQSSLVNHDFTGKLRDSGYTENHSTFDHTGWMPHPTLHSDMKRTEYRIQYNPKKSIHYTGPLFSTGKLKMKETNYKHT